MANDYEDYAFSGDEEEQESDGLEVMPDSDAREEIAIQDRDCGGNEEEPPPPSSSSFMAEQKPRSLSRSLDEAQIRQDLNSTIASVAALFSTPEDTACILLRNFRWDVVKLQDMWFADEGRVRQSAGLLPGRVGNEDSELHPAKKKLRLHDRIECQICFSGYSVKRMEAAGCGHLFCNNCWKSYITTAINDGPGCLTLRCPQVNCSVSVDDRLISKLVSSDIKERYDLFLVRNFVECSKVIKWCPAPGCNYAVEFMGLGNEGVFCRCMYAFCWDCVDEWHSPVDCETALKWHAKNNADSGNAEWILANSKPCPKCHRSIEKNLGCNHMTCRAPCKHQFCWTCLGPWDKHNNGTAYTCNRYTEDEDSKKKDEERKLAKVSWHKYNHYYERWITNSISREKAVNNLKGAHVENMKTLSSLYSESDKNLDECFVSAWKQIIECRRVLKWTYAYGYYMPVNIGKKNLFEYLQGHAESALERLHHCAEEELKQYVEDDEDAPKKSKEAFMNYRLKLIQYTKITRKFFDNLVKGLETGLEEVMVKL